MVNEVTEGRWQIARCLNVTDDGQYVVRNQHLPEDERLGVRIPAGSWVREMIDYLATPRTRSELAIRFPSSALDKVLTRLHRSGVAFHDSADEETFVIECTARAVARRALRLASAAQVLDGDMRGHLGRQETHRLDQDLKQMADQLGQLAASLEETQRQRAAARIAAALAGLDATELKLHLGCGNNIMKSWLNVDLVGGDVRLDLRAGLPIPAGSARYIYCSHVLEHLLYPDEALGVCREIHRVLRPGGVVRIVVPDIELCIRAYAADDREFFDERSQHWEWARRAATPLDQFLAYAGANRSPFDSYGHKYGFDFETLSGLLRQAGFALVRRSAYMHSEYPELRVDDGSVGARLTAAGEHLSLFVEAERVASPASSERRSLS